MNISIPDMTVGEVLKEVVEARKEGVLISRISGDRDEGERADTLFINAVTAYGIWLTE